MTASRNNFGVRRTNKSVRPRSFRPDLNAAEQLIDTTEKRLRDRQSWVAEMTKTTTLCNLNGQDRKFAFCMQIVEAARFQRSFFGSDGVPLPSLHAARQTLPKVQIRNTKSFMLLTDRALQVLLNDVEIVMRSNGSIAAAQRLQETATDITLQLNGLSLFCSSAFSQPRLRFRFLFRSHGDARIVGAAAKKPSADEI